MPVFNLAGFLETQIEKIPPNFHLKFLINNLKLSGCWPPKDGKKTAYTIWSIFVISFSLGHLILAQTAFIVSARWTDREEMASVLSLLINNFVHLLKLSLVLRHQSRIQVLLDFAEAEKFIRDDKGRFKRLQYKFSRSAFMYYANFQFARLAACAGWILSSVIKSLKDSNHRTFPMNALYGWDAMISPIYEITVVCQSVGVLICCVQNVSMDGLITGFMAVIGCEFEILKTRITEIGNDVKELGGAEYIAMNILKRKDIDERIYKELMLCVEHHLAIFWYTRKFEEIFQSAILLLFLDNCCVICMTAFALSQLKEYHLTTILGNLMYLAAITYQLFMYCYFGNIVAIQRMLSMEANFHIKVSLGMIFYLGTWPPEGRYRSIYMIYAVASFVFILGIYLIVQTVYLIVIWGDIEKMVAGAFLLMTNTSHAFKSESVVSAAYAGNWWRCGERYKRGLRLLMTRAKEPLTLKAGNLLTLSLPTFVTILRASYSFFTVLQSSTDKTAQA